MGKKNNRICCICGRGYEYCPTCGKDAGKPTWYFIFDGQNCHDIYEVCTQYRDGKIDVKTAYETISLLDISNLDDFAEATKAQIMEIMKYKEDKDVDSENTTNINSNNNLPKINYAKNKIKK